MPDTVVEQIMQFCDTNADHFLQLNLEHKQCRQITLSPEQPELSEYISVLNDMISEYLAEWYPGVSHEIMSNFNIQSYAPGEGFINWHNERGTTQGIIGDRSLVFMTYLNTVPDGPTHFKHQQLRIEAEAGKTVIWPADWTHTHCGEVSETQPKHIVTGWITLDSPHYYPASIQKDDVNLAAQEDILADTHEFVMKYMAHIQKPSGK
jgi:hypothetical protein